jgi:hypothetical protein
MRNANMVPGLPVIPNTINDVGDISRRVCFPHSRIYEIVLRRSFAPLSWYISSLNPIRQFKITNNVLIKHHFGLTICFFFSSIWFPFYASTNNVLFLFRIDNIPKWCCHSTLIATLAPVLTDHRKTWKGYKPFLYAFFSYY